MLFSGVYGRGYPSVCLKSHQEPRRASFRRPGALAAVCPVPPVWPNPDEGRESGQSGNTSWLSGIDISSHSNQCVISKSIIYWWICAFRTENMGNTRKTSLNHLIVHKFRWVSKWASTRSVLLKLLQLRHLLPQSMGYGSRAINLLSDYYRGKHLTLDDPPVACTPATQESTQSDDTIGNDTHSFFIYLFIFKCLSKLKCVFHPHAFFSHQIW